MAEEIDPFSAEALGDLVDFNPPPLGATTPAPLGAPDPFSSEALGVAPPDQSQALAGIAADAEVSPAVYAAARSAAKDLDIPVLLALQEPARARSAQTVQEAQKLFNQHPGMREFFLDPDNRMLTRDDIPALRNVGTLLNALKAQEEAATFSETLGDTFEATTLIPGRVGSSLKRFLAESGALNSISVSAALQADANASVAQSLLRGVGADKRAADVIRLDIEKFKVTPEAVRAIAEVSKKRAAEFAHIQERATAGDFWKEVVFGGVTSLATMAPAIAASIMTGSPAVGLSIMGTVVFGDRYEEARNRGWSIEAASAEAFFFAGVEVISEKIPLDAILGKTPGFVGVLKAMGLESLQEMFVTSVEIGYDLGVLDKSMTVAEAFRALSQAGIVGAGIGGTLRGGTMAIQKSIGAVLPDPKASPYEEALRELRAEVSATEIEARSPETMRAALDAMSDGAEIYINADDIVELEQGGTLTLEELADAGAPEELIAALELGGDIKVSAAALLSLDPKVFDTLAPSVRRSIGADTAKEAGQKLADREENIARLLEGMRLQVEADATARPVYTVVERQLRESGRYDDAQVDKMASLLAEQYETRAANTTLTAEELFLRDNVSISAAAGGQPAVTAPDPDAPVTLTEGADYTATTASGTVLETDSEPGGPTTRRVILIPEKKALPRSEFDNDADFQKFEALRAEVDARRKAGRAILAKLRETQGQAFEQNAKEFGVSAEVLKAELDAVGGVVTDTPAFKKWFGDSKVVDADGNPMVVYHGTAADIEAFNPTALYSAERQEYMKEFGQAGMYFTADAKYAAAYGPAVYPLYLSIQNPFVIPGPTFWESVKEAATGSGEKITETSYISRSRIEELEAQGYDGIINPNAKEIIAFRPEQIKSTFNRGAFDPASDNILEQSSAALQVQPLDITPASGGSRVTLWDYGTALTDRHMAEYGRALDPSDPADYQTVLSSLRDEYNEQIAQDDSGSGWYVEDIASAIDVTKTYIPELSDPLNRDLFLIMAAALSPQQKPPQNWENASLAMRGMLDATDGRIPLRKPNGKQYGVLSHTTGLQMIQYLIDTEGGIAGAVTWLSTPKTGTELAQMRRATGLFSPTDKKTGKVSTKDAAYIASETNLSGTYIGASALGPKVGEFLLNSTGIDPDAVTVDLWLFRTYNRLVGTLLDVAPAAQGKEIQSQSRSITERAMIKRLVRDLASEVGISPSAMQAALWYFEQRLATAHGVNSPSTNFSGSAALAAERRGIDPVSIEAAKAAGNTPLSEPSGPLTLNQDADSSTSLSGMYNPVVRVVDALPLPEWKVKVTPQFTPAIAEEAASLENEQRLQTVEEDGAFYGDVMEWFKTPAGLRLSALYELKFQDDMGYTDKAARDNATADGAAIWKKLSSTDFGAGVNRKGALKWTGIEEFLTAVPGQKFSKPAVLSFLSKNGLVVEEVIADTEAREGELDWDTDVLGAGDVRVSEEIEVRAQEMVDEFNPSEDDYVSVRLLDIINDSNTGVGQEAIADIVARHVAESGPRPAKENQNLDLFEDADLNLSRLQGEWNVKLNNLFVENLYTDDIVADAARIAAEQDYDENPYILSTVTLPNGYEVDIFGNEDVGYSDDTYGASAYNLWEAQQQVLVSAVEAGVFRDEDDPTTTRHETYTEGTYTNYIERKLSLPDIEGDFFKEDHFGEERNVVAFTRESDRVLDGKRVKSLDELQSDWHQKGRQVGYVTGEEGLVEASAYNVKKAAAAFEALPPMSKEAVSAFIEDVTIEEVTDTSHDAAYDTKVIFEVVSGQTVRFGDAAGTASASLLVPVPEFLSELQSLLKKDARLQHFFDLIEYAAQQHKLARAERMGVPAAPFDEDAWISLGVKRALLDAARGGYEGFMFPSSRVLSARYSDRARKMYEIQYDQKMPSIIKKLTGQTPRAVAFEGRDYYTIDFTPELIAEINDTGFSMFQDETEGLTARGSYRRQTDPYGNIANIITLLEGADLSTFLHESAHFWMYQMRQDLDSDYMTEQGRLQLQKQWDTATAWFEKNSKQAWSDYKKLTKAARKNADAKPEDADIQRRANLLEAGLSRGERGGGDVYMAEIARNFMNGSVEESGTLEVAFHELWARAGERYLAEGKAPSASLRPLFASFSSWMTHIYRNLGRLNVTLDEDIRGVFDRLLATEEAINAERQREAYKIPREVRDLANDNELADIERLVKDAELEAQQQMQLVVAEEIDELNSQERKAAEEKAREEISKEVYKEPAYAAIELSRRGVLPDGTQLTDPDGKPTKMKLFREEFVALFGVDAARAMPRGMLTKNAADATDISTVAMLAGFSSQDEMVATLKVSRVRATDAINQRVKLRMDEEFPQLTDPAVAADRAAEVVLNEKQLELAQLQARILQRKVRETIGRGAQRQAIEEGAPPLSEDVARIEGVEDASGFADTAADAVPEQLAAIAAEEQRAANIPQRKAQSAARRRITTLMSSLDMEAVRLAAADYIDRALVSDLTPQRYIAAAERLSRKVSKAIASRDYEEAMVLLEQKALNLAIAKQARDAQKKINGLLKRQRALLRRSDKKLANGYDLKILNAGRAVMERLGVAVVRVGRLDVDEVLEDAAGAFVDPAALTEFENKVRGLMSIADAYANKAGEAYRDMPYGVFLQVAQEVQSIVTEARSARSLLVDGKRITHETIVAEMSAQTADRGRVDVKAAGRGTTQQREHITKWGTLKAASTRVESWARAMDSGRPDGPFNTYIIKPVFDAITTYYTERRAPLEALVEVLRPLAGSLAGSGTIAAPELDGYVFQNKAELLHAILHTGNESNKSKLLRAGQVDVANEKTYQWAPPVEKGSGVDTKQWDAFMARMYAEGIITKADMDAAQRVWNIFKETKGAAQKAHYRMFGFYFVTIEDSPVVTPFGTYPGGYVPAVTDKMMDIQGGARVDADNLASQQNASMFPNAEAGFTKARVESYAQPLELDILRIPAHLDRVMKFAYLGPTVREVAQLVTGAPFRSMMNRFNRFAVDQLIIPWLQRTVRQSVTTGDASRGWSRGLTALSNRVGMQVMAGNIVNAAQQLTGISSAAVIVPPKLLMKHLFHYKEDGVGIREFISQHSGYMDVRFRNGVSDMMQEIETILTAKTRLQRGQEVSQRYAYFAQQATQNLVDPVVWMAAFDHAKELGVWQRAHDAHNDGTVDENGVSVAVRKADAAAAYYADSVVRQTQSPMGPAEVSRIETGIPLWRIIMKFYGYFNSMLNLVGAEADTIRREVGYKGKAGRFFYLYLVGVLIPSVVAEGISMAARGKFDEVEDDDELAVVLAELFLLSQIKFAAAMIPAGGAVISRVVGQFTPATYDDRLSFSPVISIADNALGGVLRLGKDAVMGLSGGDTRDASQIVRDGLNAVGIWIGLPTNWFSKPIQYLLKVEEGKADPENVADYVEGFLTGRDGTKR